MDLISVIHQADHEVSPDTIINSVLSSRSRPDAYQLLIDFFNTSTLQTERIIEAVASAWNYLEHNHLWNVHFQSMALFEESFPLTDQIKDLVNESANNRQRTQRILDKIETVWGYPLAECLPQHMVPPRIARNVATYLLAVAKLLTHEDAVERIQEEIDNRVAHPTSGVSACTHITHRDITRVHKQVAAAYSRAATADQLAEQQAALQIAPPPLPAPAQIVQVVLTSNTMTEAQRAEYYRDPVIITPDTAPLPQTACKRCPPWVRNDILNLTTNKVPAHEVDSEHFDKAVAIIDTLCWDCMRPYFNRSAHTISNTVGGRDGLIANIQSLYAHLQSGQTYLDYVAAHPEQFQAGTRPYDHRDAHRPYRYPPWDTTDPAIDPHGIFADFCNDPGAYDQFLTTGNVIIPGFLDYLNRDPITSFMEDEFRMYQYHHRVRTGATTQGFLRTMFYGIIQQAIRIDPGYYALNVAARPDHQWRLISYPYVAKSTIPGQRTGFLHCDINLDAWNQDGFGKNQLTSSISLDDEDDDNCTVLIEGFTKHIPAWLGRVHRRERITRIPGITTDATKRYTAEDKRDFGAPLPFPVDAFGVRLTRPEILHGSTPNSSVVRRVIYPWFSAIQEDHETMEIPGQHTWSELASLHIRMDAPKKGVSGAEVVLDRPPYPFPAAIKLGALPPICDALRGHAAWTDPLVQSQRDVILGPDRTAAAQVIAAIRLEIYHSVHRAYERMEAVEREIYGPCSYFLNNGVRVATPGADSPGESTQDGSMDID
jgi:hypothetical protein